MPRVTASASSHLHDPYEYIASACELRGAVMVCAPVSTAPKSMYVNGECILGKAEGW